MVGATRRAGAVGNTVVRNLVRGGFPGPLFAVNPGYTDVEGVPCFPSLGELPRRPQQVIFAVGDSRIEGALEDAIACGAESCVIYSSLVLAGDRTPPLRDRIARRIADAGLLVCGGNGMGYYNFRDGIWACGFETRSHRSDGGITLISQSGAGMSGILDVDERLDFNFAVSSGQELAVTVEDYLDWALEQPETRVVGLFLETSRRPQRFIEVLNKAARRQIPVVAIKAGRTELAARLAVSHSGALAGSDRVYDAVFDRCGVQRVDDMNELADALIMFAASPRVPPGGVVSLHDSGGERQLFIDLAGQRGVALTELQPSTVRRLEALLDPGLPAVNPLDAWSAGGEGASRKMAECFATLLTDPGAALGAVVHDRTAGGGVYPEYADYLRAGKVASGKPVFLVSARQGTGPDDLAIELTREGLPVLDGVSSFLAGARCLMAWRDFQARPAPMPVQVQDEIVSRWRTRLAAGNVPGECEALALLSEAGIPAPSCTPVSSEAELEAALAGARYPVVLKTANPAIAHKTRAGGVALGLRDAGEVREAYRRMAKDLGPAALIAPMVQEPGVEMILGLTVDDQFGPVVLLGFGGVHAEILEDVVAALPPFDAATARRLLGKLRLRRLLEGPPAVDVEAYCRAAANLSALAPHIGDLVQSIDINPVKVLANGCIALDALVVPVAQAPGQAAERARRAGG